jgi:hypothetical protein
VTQGKAEVESAKPQDAEKMSFPGGFSVLWGRSPFQRRAGIQTAELGFQGGKGSEVPGIFIVPSTVCALCLSPHDSCIPSFHFK